MSPTDINQRARAFSKMHLWAPLRHCAFSSQTQNTTFSKKLHFIPNQTDFLYLLSSKWGFWVRKAETNRHLYTCKYQVLLSHPKIAFTNNIKFLFFFFSFFHFVLKNIWVILQLETILQYFYKLLLWPTTNINFSFINSHSPH